MGFNLEGSEMHTSKLIPGSLADRLQAAANLFGHALTAIEAEIDQVGEELGVHMIDPKFPEQKERVRKMPPEFRRLVRKLEKMRKMAAHGMFDLEAFILDWLGPEDGLIEQHYGKDENGKWKALSTQ